MVNHRSRFYDLDVSLEESLSEELIFRRKTQSISSAAGSYGYVTDNGRVYVGGRHGMSVYPETGQVLGLDGTHMVSFTSEFESDFD